MTVDAVWTARILRWGSSMAYSVGSAGAEGQRFSTAGPLGESWSQCGLA